MTQQRATQEQRYLSAFESLANNGFTQDPIWVQQLRRDAIGHFQSLGFPVARRGNEEWKYTDVRPIATSAFSPPAPSGTDASSDEGVKAHAFAGAQHSRLIFVNGTYVPELSSTEALPPTVQLENLAESLWTSPNLTERHLAHYADYKTNAFTALNTSFLHHGVLLHVPDGVVVQSLIQLIFLSTATNTGAITSPRLLVLMGAGAQASVIETHVGIDAGAYFTNAVMETVLGPGARLDHYTLQYEGKNSYHITTNQVVQARDSSYTSLVLDAGGALVRHNINVLLQEEGASVSLHGLYLLNGAQHVDYSTFIDHAVPHTSSKELYKGVLKGAAHVVFGGKILVRPGAQQTSSHQTNKTLLLSAGAAVDTKPELEIYADDVKCGHGAAIGQVDPATIFYLKSRGLDEKAAMELLTHGFVNEVLSTVPHVPFRAYLDQLLHTQLTENEP
jgi:Fe-S cluster assembly protein SufD